jgi:hypothetical protein
MLNDVEVDVVWIGDIDALGFIPLMVSRHDQRDAVAQLHDGYAYGGGWRDFDGFTFDRETAQLTYPGDPPLDHVAHGILRNELILVYPYGWVCVVQADKTKPVRIARMD